LNEFVSACEWVVEEKFFLSRVVIIFAFLINFMRRRRVEKEIEERKNKDFVCVCVSICEASEISRWVNKLITIRYSHRIIFCLLSLLKWSIPQ
jgi:hypothetical protein